MLHCQNCGKEARLILSVCAECDPELHNAWDAAVKSQTGETYQETPEALACFQLVQKRKLEGYGHKPPAGFISESDRIS